MAKIAFIFISYKTKEENSANFTFFLSRFFAIHGAEVDYEIHFLIQVAGNLFNIFFLFNILTKCPWDRELIQKISLLQCRISYYYLGKIGLDKPIFISYLNNVISPKIFKLYKIQSQNFSLQHFQSKKHLCDFHSLLHI